jgi:hypothetical protein
MQSGFSTDLSLQKQAKFKSVQQPLDRLYETQKKPYGWDNIHRGVARDYFYCGAIYEWNLGEEMTEEVCPEEIRIPKTPNTLSEICQARSSAGPIPTASAKSVTPPKNYNNSIARTGRAGALQT